MKGKTKNKKLIKVLILAVCFVLTIVVSASVTLAWFYDSDWASDNITMAGAVGIQMRDSDKNPTHGEGALHFEISTQYAYPGQAMEIQASVFNNGGSSIVNHFNGKTYNNGAGYNSSTNYNDTDIKNAGNSTSGPTEAKVGSPCYVRAQFLVLTNIGSGEIDGTGLTPEEIQAEKDANAEFSAREIYNALIALINTRNTSSSDYDWVYDRNPNASIKFDNVARPVTDLGYFYLCENNTNTLKQLVVGGDAAFLFEDTFVIPWTLTNFTADKDIYIAVSFEAIQTFIPELTGTDAAGWNIVSSEKDNQADDDSSKAGYQNYYYSTNVQIVFNTSRFSKPSFAVKFGDGHYTVGDATDIAAATTANYTLISGTTPASTNFTTPSGS